MLPSLCFGPRALRLAPAAQSLPKLRNRIHFEDVQIDRVGENTAQDVQVSTTSPRRAASTGYLLVPPLAQQGRGDVIELAPPEEPNERAIFAEVTSSIFARGWCKMRGIFLQVALRELLQRWKVAPLERDAAYALLPLVQIANRCSLAPVIRLDLSSHRIGSPGGQA